MSKVATIEAVLLLDSRQFDKGFQDAGARLGEFESRSNSFASTFAENMRATVFSTAALAAGLGLAVNAAKNFDSGLRTLNTITKLGEEQLATYGDRLSTISLELGTTTGAAENAGAAYEVASAGFANASENALVLEATLKAASAGGDDAGRVAKLLAGSLKAYGVEASQAGRFSDVFFETVNKGIVTIPELSASLGQITGIAATAGISIEELGAAIATSTAGGVPASSAIDGLRGAIGNLLAPSKQAKDELARLGLTVNETTLKNKGLARTLDEISRANGGSAASFKLILGDIQAINVALSLVKGGGDQFRQNLDDITAATGATDAALAEKGKSLAFSIGQFSVAMEAAGVAIGNVFLPPLKLMVDAATDAVKAFLSIPEDIRNTGIAVVAIGGAFTAAASAIGALTLLLGGAKFAFTALTVVKAADALITNQLTGALVRLAVAKGTATIAATGFGKAVQGTAASLIAQAAAMKATEAAAYSLATGQAAATTATFSLTTALNGFLAAAVRSLGLIALGAVAISQALKLAADLRYESEQAAAFVDQAGERAKFLDDAFKSAGKSAQELFSGGKSSKDLVNELDGLKQGIEDTNRAFEDGLITEDERIKRLGKLNAATKTLLGTRQELIKLEDSRKADRAVSVDVPVYSDPEQEKKRAELAEKARKEALAGALSDIKVLSAAKELSATQEIAKLEEVLQKNKTTAAERRSIEEDIARLKGEVKTDKTDAIEAKRKAALDVELTRINDLRTQKKISADQEVMLLDRVLAKLKLTEDEKRSINSKTLDIKAQQQQAADDKAAKLADEAKQKADKATQDALDQSKKETEDLAKAQAKGQDLSQDTNARKVQTLQIQTETTGKDNTAAIRAALEENLAIEIQQIQAAAAREAATVKSADLRAQIEANAEAEIRAEIAKTADATKSAIDEQIEALKKLEAEKKKANRAESSFGVGYGIEELGDRLKAEQATTRRRKKTEPIKGPELGKIEEQLKVNFLGGLSSQLAATGKVSRPQGLARPEGPVQAAERAAGRKTMAEVAVTIQVDGPGKVADVKMTGVNGDKGTIELAGRGLRGIVKIG